MLLSLQTHHLSYNFNVSHAHNILMKIGYLWEFIFFSCQLLHRISFITFLELQNYYFFPTAGAKNGNSNAKGTLGATSQQSYC